MDHEKIVAEIARELGVSITDDAISTMIKLLEGGIHPDNLVKVFQESKAELH
ncbi:hypothetical protein PAEPH01_1162 [Pancytospora epiphaga]|nr:hypothetical protein PAEPH01_1162 [Pancytospora epiphaga]